MKKLLIGAGLAFLTFAGLAISQTISVPIVSTVNPVADVIQIAPGGQPGPAQYVTPAQISNSFGYYKSAPATSPMTYTFANNVAHAALRPTGTLAAAYFTLAATPSDGQRQCSFTTAQLTAAYVAANTGQSINNALSATNISANTGFCYIYSASNATWDRD